MQGSLYHLGHVVYVFGASHWESSHTRPQMHLSWLVTMATGIGIIDYADPVTLNIPIPQWHRGDRGQYSILQAGLRAEIKNLALAPST